MMPDFTYQELVQFCLHRIDVYFNECTLLERFLKVFYVDNETFVMDPLPPVPAILEPLCSMTSEELNEAVEFAKTTTHLLVTFISVVARLGGKKLDLTKATDFVGLVASHRSFPTWKERNKLEKERVLIPQLEVWCEYARKSSETNETFFEDELESSMTNFFAKR